MKTLNRTISSGKSLNSLREKLKSQEDLLERIRTLLTPPLHDHCVWSVLNKGELILFTDSPAWASRLRYLSSNLQQQLRREGLSIRRVLVKVSLSNKEYLQKSGARNLRRANPISQSNAQLLRSIAQTVDDPSLKASLERLSKHAKE
jgi:hypothetical protein